MQYVPSYGVLKRWMAQCTVAGSTRLEPTYDDVLDVLGGFLRAVPVNEDWYTAEYPAIRGFLAQTPTETPSSHFQKHGYFGGRKPFSPGWQGLVAPIPFTDLKTSLHIVPRRGRLLVDIGRDGFLILIKSILLAAPIDETWYRATYPMAAKAIDKVEFPSVTKHYVEHGYFDGMLPCNIVVDEEWYISRYHHVRTGLKRGVAKSAQDHFMRVGYNEGCRPTPP